MELKYLLKVIQPKCKTCWQKLKTNILNEHKNEDEDISPNISNEDEDISPHPRNSD